MGVEEDETELISDLIRGAVRELTSDIDQVKKFISDEIDDGINNSSRDGEGTKIAEYVEVSLSAVDDAFIEQKYIQYSLEFWLKEIERFFNDDKNLSFESVRDLLHSLDTIKDLHEIPEPLNQFRYYTLLETNRDLIRRNTEKTIIRRFKSTCLEKIIDYLGFAQTELDFLKALDDFLLTSKNIRVIIAELELVKFCNGLLSFNQVIDKITNLQVGDHGLEVIPLQTAAESLKNREQLFLTKMFRDVIKAYIKPVEINVTTLDGRSVVEVKGKSVVMSSILGDLEKKISENLDITELRVVGAGVLHADASLRKEIWHGKNVVILVKKMILYDKIAWNVSGKDSDHIYLGNAGTGQDGHGKRGADGYAGESGGNVLIEVDKIENAGNLAIISNGGAGSKGQDGGDGTDGTHGRGVTEDEFQEMFPSVVTFSPDQSRRDRLLRTSVRNLTKVSTMKTQWELDGNMFIESTSREGNEITFSYAAPSFGQCLQAFLLYKGSEGQRGKQGGEYGLGGEGGCNGEINTNNKDINIESNRGQSGQNGNGGFYGGYGKNGWDMGYTDYLVWGTAELYGSDQSSKLQLTYHDTSWSRAPKDAVWCPRHIAYAQITATGLDHKKEKKYQEQADTRQNYTLQHHAQATKRKSILRGKILADYSHCYSSVERSTIQDSECSLENIMQRALQAMIENSEQQENVAAELEVKHVMSIRLDKNIPRYKSTTTTSSVTLRDTPKMDIESLIDLLTSDAVLDGQYNGIKNIEHDLSDLDKIFSQIEKKDKNAAQNTETEKLKLLLIEKYRFAMLRKIADQFPDHWNATSPVHVTAKSASRYLILAKKNDDTISHEVLGTLNQYLYKNDKKQRENICKFIEEGSWRRNIDEKALKRSVERFVLDAVRSAGVCPAVKKYYYEYLEFPEKKRRSLDILLEPLITGLKNHKDVFDLWIKRDKSHSIKLQLAVILQREEHKLLNVMHYRYNNKLEETYDWSKCCEDKAFLKEYFYHFLESGPLSESYRELLAYLFDVNIRLYFESRENQFHLLDNHKPLSKHIVHVLRGEGAFKQFDLDQEYLRLEYERAAKGCKYARVLAETTKFNEKQKFDDYFEKGILLPGSETENTVQDRYVNSVDDVESVYELCREELEDEELEDFKQSITEFILDAGGSEKAHSEVKKYYNEFLEFSEKRNKCLELYFEPFYSELQRYKHIFALWIARNNNRSAENELTHEIRRHHFLNILYTRYNNQLEREYDWTDCCENRDIIDAHGKYIEETGSLPESFTELIPQRIDPSNGLEEEYENEKYLYTHNLKHNDSIELDEEADKLPDSHIRYVDNAVSDDEYPDREEQYIIDIMKHFSCPEERLQIKERLEKVTSQYTGHRGILHYLSSRFRNDGMHVSFQELCYLVNSILTSVIQDRKEMNIFCWIVAACPQKRWIDELLLLHLENYFKAQLKDKYRWKGYLSKLLKKDILLSLALELDQHKSSTPITIQSIDQTLKLLSDLPNEEISLEGLDLREWPYALKGRYWAIELSKLTRGESENLSEASYYLSSMENTFGAPLVKKFMKILQEGVKKSSSVSREGLTNILSNFYNGRWNLSEEELKILSDCGISEWQREMERKFTVDQNERNITLLVELIRGNSNTSVNISTKLAKIQQSLQSIRKVERGTNARLANVISRLYGRAKNSIGRWFKNPPDDSEEASENLTAAINPVPSVQRQEPSANGQARGYDVGVQFAIGEESLQDILERVNNIDETIAGHMNLCDIEVYSRMFEACLKSFSADKCGERDEFVENSRIGMLAVIDRAIELKREFRLRDTQKFAILALLMNEHKTLAQVSTGEGKSLIVVAASIMKAICNEKVDIITSSSVLAKRDAEANRDIYSLFGISVSHNCNEDIEKRRASYSSSQVVFGDLSNFQRDYLLDRFYDKNILGDRDFVNVFVDEVDSMLLDKGNNMLYLSHDLEGFDKLESVYLFIWRGVGVPAETIRAAVLYDLYGLITKEDIKRLDNELDEQRAAIIFERLIQAEILDDQGKMLGENIGDNELRTILSPNLSEYENCLSHLLRECARREKFISVPNYLKPFVREHLDAWINSAITAAGMQEGHDYVIDVDRTGTSRDLNPHITIVDRDTGTDQANSQWDEALHQFLQLKHGCKLSLQSLKAVFISNVSYFKQYTNLYGVTGTLGSLRERNLLLEIHNVEFITIPTSRPKQFYEEIPIFCAGKEEWIETMFSEAKAFTMTMGRSVLIICETIDDAETFYRAFLRRGLKKKVLHKYTRDYKEFDIAKGQEKLRAGQIIIATNLSGRGTNIKIEDELRNAGGLHVCLTYLPKNSRIEQQAFGRGARSGDKGSGRLIIMGAKSEGSNDSEILDPETSQRVPEKLTRSSDMKKNDNKLKILYLKKQRDADELRRISEIKEYYETRIMMEEKYFNAFDQLYKKLTKYLTDKNESKEVKNILMRSCLDKWSFWLDRNSKWLENSSDDEARENSEDTLEKFIQELSNLTDKDYRVWVKDQPVQIIKLGKDLCQRKKYKDAIQLFDEVIQLEPLFCEAAHYYKAFALLNDIGWEKKNVDRELKAELLKAARLLNERIKSSMYAENIIKSTKRQDEKSIIQIDTYAEQQKSLRKLYRVFSESIAAVFDRPINPSSFVNGNVNEELSAIVYETLLENDILERLHIKSHISDRALENINFQYGIAIGELKDFLSSFKNEKIDEQDFRKTLKKDVKLPSQKDFWKQLAKKSISNREVRCIIVDVERLKKVDPSLLHLLRKKITENELTQESLNCNEANEIIRNRPAPGVSETSNIILEKGAFKKLIDNKEKYEFLKRICVFVSNRKALIDVSKIASTPLSRYDSITLKDFSKENIKQTEAKQILAQLVDLNVLKKVNSPLHSYRLAIPFGEIHQIEFTAHQVYRNAVIGLFSLCFKYRGAIEQIETQIKLKKKDEENVLIYPRLPVEPHNCLIHELIAQTVISPVRSSVDIEHVEHQVREIYRQKITRNQFKKMILRSKLIPDEKNNDDLFDHLVKSGWLRIINDADSDISETNPHSMSVSEINSAFDLQYSINDSEARTELSSYQDIKETLEQIFNNELELSKNDTIQQIINLLNRSRSPLKVSKTLCSSLKPLTECNGLDGSRHIEEINIFALNGLDQLLIIESRNWSLRAFINTAIVMVMGVIQILVGFVVEACTSVAGLAASIIIEGVNDIIFAINTIKSKHFSWQNYLQYKVQSVMSTIITGGVLTAVTSYFRNSLRFGSQVAESVSNVRTRVVQTSGFQRIIRSAPRGLAMAAGNRAVSNTISSVAFGFANGKADTLVQNYIRSLCDDIGSAILSTIKAMIGERDIPGFFGNAYQALGYKNALKLMDESLESFFSNESLMKKYLPTASKTARSATRGIQTAVDQMSRNRRGRSDNRPPVEIIRAVLALVPKVAELVDDESIRRSTGSLLNNFEKILTHEIHNGGSATNDRSRRVREGNRVPNCEDFKQKSTNKWMLLLNENVGKIIEQFIVRPILNEGVDCLTAYCESMIRSACPISNVGRNNDRYDQLRRQFQERQLADAPLPALPTLVEIYTSKEYHNNLNTLMSKTNNYKLLAALVRENVPMNAACLIACVKVIIEVSGIKGLTIVVEGHRGVKKRLLFYVEEPDVRDNHVIQLVLIKNRFRLHGSDASELHRPRVGQTERDCLYEAVKDCVNLNMTPQEFRAEIANCIQRDSDVQKYIKQGLTSLFSSTSPPCTLIKVETVEKGSRSNAVDDGEAPFSQSSTTNCESRDQSHKRQPRNNRSLSVDRAFPTHGQRLVKKCSPYI